MTPKVARGEIFDLLKTAWDAGGATAALTMHYQNVRTAVNPTADADGVVPSWGKAFVIHAGGTQQTVGGPTKRFQRFGTTIVQLFVPRGAGLIVEMDDMIEVCLAAFEGKSTPSGVWFRDVGFTEAGEDGPWFQTNVSAGFRYDEVR